jgi:cell division protein FtsW (lipid II flippase)
MRNASIAEWTLCRFTNRERAASIVGDLLETKQQKGPLWFWLSFAGVVFSLVWRRPLAFVAALYAGMWSIGAFQMAIVGIRAQHRPPEHPWVPIFLVLGAAGSALCAMSSYAAIKHGPRDQTARLAFALTGLVTAVVFLWWQPVVLGVCVVATLVLVYLCLLSGERRGYLLTVVVSVVVLNGAEILTMFIGSCYQRLLLPGPWGTREWQEHPSADWVYCCMLILSYLAATSVWSRLHKRPSRSRILESRSEML